MTLNSELPRLARAILNSNRSPESVMRERMPRFLAHLKRVRAEPSVLRRWGRCVNVDEFAGTEIVDPKIQEMLSRQTNVDMIPPGVHAGVQHTYGYLLSLIETPYGYKRSRWLRPVIERAFNLPTQSLQAFPRRGVLLSNLTDFLSQLSLRDQRPPKINGPRPISDAWDASGISGVRITEQVTRSKQTRVQIHTDLIPFVCQQTPTSDCALLVYCIAINDQGAKLITTFPINDQMRAELLSQVCGRNVDVRLRFNAFIAAIGADSVPGRRTISEWSIP